MARPKPCWLSPAEYSVEDETWREEFACASRDLSRAVAEAIRNGRDPLATSPVAEAIRGARDPLATSREAPPLAEAAPVDEHHTNDRQLPSLGSLGHALGSCHPCVFVHTGKGCNSGASCSFCHMCTKKDIAEKAKLRQRDRREQWRLLRKERNMRKMAVLRVSEAAGQKVCTLSPTGEARVLARAEMMKEGPGGFALEDLEPLTVDLAYTQ